MSHSGWNAPFLGLGSDKLMKLDTDDNQPYPSNSCIGSLLFMKIFRLISRENLFSISWTLGLKTTVNMEIIQTTCDRIIFIYWVLKHNVQLCCCTLKSLLSQMSNLQLLHKGKMAYWQNQGGHIRCVGFHVHRCGYSISKPGNTLAYWRCRTYYAPCRSPACPESLFGRWLPEQ